MKRNLEAEKKGSLLLPFKGKSGFPPLLNTLRSMLSLLGLTEALKGGLAASVVEPIHHEYHSELLPSFVIP